MSSLDKRRIATRFMCRLKMMKIRVGVNSNNNNNIANIKFFTVPIYQQCDSAGCEYIYIHKM
jgi:hypothetical protein